MAAASATTVTGTVAQVVTERPSVIVRNQNGAAMGGVTVTFTVTAGGGSVSDATVTTTAAGSATVGSWTLGAIAGTNTLTASSGSLTPVTFTATASAAAAATLTKTAGDAQNWWPGEAVGTKPAVTVKDAHGNLVSSATITFAVTGGGGSVTEATAISAASGVATVGSWTLGGQGSQSLTASAAGASPAVFTATAVDPCVWFGDFVVGTLYVERLQSLDCKFAQSGQFYDNRRLTIPTAGAYTFTQRSSAFDAWLNFYVFDGTDINAGRALGLNDDGFSTGTDARIKALLPSGSYLVRPNSFDAGATGEYTFIAETASAEATSCEEIFVVPGITTSQTLATDCAYASAPTWLVDEFKIYLRAGQTVTISMNSTAVDAYLRLHTNCADYVTLVENNNSGSGTTNARITYTVPAGTTERCYTLHATAASAGSAGAYTLIIE